MEAAFLFCTYSFILSVMFTMIAVLYYMTVLSVLPLFFLFGSQGGIMLEISETREAEGVAVQFSYSLQFRCHDKRLAINRDGSLSKLNLDILCHGAHDSQFHHGQREQIT